MFVLIAAAIVWIAQKLPVEARVPAGALVCAAMILFGVNVGRDIGIFRQALYEQRHVRAAAEVASRTPERAVVLSVQHSGSVRYYANRITLRYDWLPPDQLDTAVRDLTAKGYQPYHRRRRLGAEGISDALRAGQRARQARLAACRPRDRAAPKCASSDCRMEGRRRHNEKSQPGFPGLLRHHDRADVSARPPHWDGAPERCRRSRR